MFGGTYGLPQLGGKESIKLEFKAELNRNEDGKPNLLELAKDIAAMANAYGGTIFVGACENKKTGEMSHYKPVDERCAQEIVTSYETAARDRCRPPPLVTAARHSMGNGEVVAVNVLPFPGQPVGVRINNGEPPAFIFPMRVSTHAIFLAPEHLAMLMTAEIRRVAILLSAIPVDADCSIRLFNRSSGVNVQSLKFEGHDPFANATHFRSADQSRVTHPLDQIQTVFFNQATNTWDIAIRQYT